MEEAENYLKRDVFCLENAFNNFLSALVGLYPATKRTHPLRKITAASHAINLLKAHFPEDVAKIGKLPTHTFAYKFIKSTYFGGNTQVFKTGRKELSEGTLLYHYDIKGAYTQAIKKLLPVGEPFILFLKEGLREEERINFLNFCAERDLIFFALARVKVGDSARRFPPLPFRGKISSKQRLLYFPVGD